MLVFYLCSCYYCCLCLCYTCICRFLPFGLSYRQHAVSFVFFLAIMADRLLDREKKTFWFAILISCKEYTYTHLEWCFLFLFLLYSFIHTRKEAKNDLFYSLSLSLEACPSLTTYMLPTLKILRYLRPVASCTYI